MRTVTVKAFAKVNMTLEIGEKRRDGYHQLETLFRGISLHDLVVLSGKEHGIHLICEAPSSWGLPEDRRNLAWQAAELLCRAFPCKIPGVAIKIRKRIPAAAGLAGGSSDAAAVLLGMNCLYDLGLSAEELKDFAGRLGADVAFCLKPLAALGRGRGEELLPAPPGPTLWVVLLKPPFGLATKDVYAAWDRQGQEAEAAKGLKPHKPLKPQLPLLLKGLEEHDLRLIWDNMFNDLEKPAFSLAGDLKEYKERLAEAMEEAGGFAEESVAESAEESAAGPAAGKILLCGSGPTLAVFFDREVFARRLEERLRKVFAGSAAEEGPGIFLARTTDASDLAERIIRRDNEGRDQHDGEY